jgi:hypothetical protein
MIKIRLIPVINSFTTAKDTVDLTRALAAAHAVHKYAQDSNANAALQARCCYYVAVVEHGVHGTTKHRGRTMMWFEKALKADGVYDESIWAQQWINYYDDLTLSPDRSEASRRDKFGFGGSSTHRPKSQIKNGVDARHTELVANPEPGVHILTPVSQRFSLNVRDDSIPSPTTPINNRTLADEMDDLSDSLTSSPRTPAGNGGERLNSFSSVSSSPSSPASLTTDTTQATVDFSPNFSVQQSPSPPSIADKSAAAAEQERAQSPKTPSRAPRGSSIASGTSLRSQSIHDEDGGVESQDGEGNGGLLDRRDKGREKSVFDVKFVKKAVRMLSISPRKSKLTEELMEEGESPGFGPRSGGSGGWRASHEDV